MNYADLPDEGNPSMTCVNDECLEFLTLYSARRGDYFWADPEIQVTCCECDVPMRLARELCTIEVAS